MSDQINNLKQQGFLMRDSLLPWDVFERHKQAVSQSWQAGNGWATRIKAGPDAQVFSRQSQTALAKLEPLIRTQSNDKAFQYLYHSMHESRDDHGLIPQILADVRGAWSDVIDEIAPGAVQTNLSLTAFTSGCFLDAHNDHGDGSNAYRVTLLLYFGNDDAQSGGLVFNHKGQQDIIAPLENRSVLFVPTPETEHWVSRVPDGATPRLAMSGWLL